MSKLWISFLEFIRIVGNHSGCHQLAERSFFYKGKQFPVCARCTGVFFGHMTAIILFFCNKQICLKYSISLMSVMGLDWGLQEIGLIESTNKRRLLTGFCGGLGLYSIYALIIKYCYQKLNLKFYNY